MKTITLYRPVGLKEMELIAETDYAEFPPRLEWQPIFYPVTNQLYAEQIAKEWNISDEFSGYCGIVTAFDVDVEYLQQFEIQNVGDKNHNELWIPSERLNEFNQKINGKITIVNAFFGNHYQPSKNAQLLSNLELFK